MTTTATENVDLRLADYLRPHELTPATFTPGDNAMHRTEPQIGVTYRSSAGNLWLVVALLPHDRVRVRLASGHGAGEEFVWHVSSMGDCVPVA